MVSRGEHPGYLPGCRRERDFCCRRQAPQNLPKRRDLCAETQEPPSLIAKNRPKIGLSAGRSSTASFGGPRTWDPLIKRHGASIDFPREFFQLSQNPMIADQWLTAK